jgi:anaerobic magnesium-protoporphyrin IX monomethyl ester cyclase
MKSILLINPTNSDQIRSPGYYLMPLSILYLAGTARTVATTYVLDLNVAKSKFFQSGNTGEFSYCDTVKEEVNRLSPDFVGVSCLFSGQSDMVFNIVDAIKSVSPSAVTIIGGMHPTIFHREIIENCPNVDAVVIGEGDATLKKMLTLDMDKWDTIEGLAFRNRNHEIIVNGKTSFIEKLDELPPPAYDLFNFNDYRLNTSGWYNPKKLDIGTSAPVLTSRSCPCKCNFCGMNLIMGTKFRQRSAESVFKEIEYLHNVHNIRYFNIMDDNFTLNKKRTLQICRYIIDSKMNISFDLPNGAMTRTLDDEVIDALAEAGFAYCFLAIESGSDFIRNKVMHKDLSKDTIFRVVESFRRHPSVHLAAFFIMGMPEDTKETLDETYELIEQLDLDSYKMSVATPFPGTNLFKQCQEDNLFVKKHDRDLLWRDSTWFQRILNEDHPFFFKPYNMEIPELEEYVISFEDLRHKKHLITFEKGRQTQSVTQAMRDYRDRNPGAA